MRATAIPLLAVLVLAGAPRAADDVRVRATVLPQGRITDTTEIRLIIQIDGGGSDVSTPHLPKMTNLRVAAGPMTSRSSSFQFINGSFVSSNTVTLTYVLSAEGPGAAEIPPFDVTVSGTTYRTQPLRFAVQAGPTGPAPPSRGDRDEETDDSGVGSGDVYVEARLDRREVFVGQPAVLEVDLYAAAPVVGFNWVESPALSGFWTEDVPLEVGRDRHLESINGRNYAVYPVGKKILVPTSAGKTTITPFVSQVQVRRSSRDPFRDFFQLANAFNLLRKTRPIELTVKPLPEAGKPAAFGGAVGEFGLKVSADHRSALVGDGVSVKATVSGRGYLQGAQAPQYAPGGDFKVYDPKVVEEDRGGEDRLTSKKTWEWVVVPLRPGTIPLHAPSFAYFDPGAGAYKVLDGTLPDLEVQRGTAPVDVPIARGEVQAAGRDIAFLKSRSGALRTTAPDWTRRRGFLALFVVPWALLPIGVWWGRRQERLASDVGFARGRRAASAAAKRLARAAAKDGGKGTTFHEEVARALVDYVADRANRSGAGLTYDELDRILVAHGVDAATARRYRACLERCDFARFVPGSSGEADRGEVLAEARGLLKALEAAW